MQLRRQPDPTRRPRGLAIYLALAAAVLTAGCVQPDDPDVSITKVEADLVFGVKDPPPPVRPPNTSDEPIDEDTPFDIGQLPGFKGGGSDLNKLPKIDDSECPAAPPTATAKDPSEVQISGMPKVGIYKWKSVEEQKPAGAPPEQPGVKKTGFERRIVRNVVVESPTVHTFETVEVDVAAKQVYVAKFRVRQDAVNRQTTGNGVPISGPYAGEPDRGVSLMKLEVQDANGQTISTFEPATGVLYLPLPVASGESYQSVGVDPKSGQTMVHNATVLSRERVDACGELVDGWAVEATQTTSVYGGESVQYTFRYIIAPQYGGLMVSERTRYSGTAFQFDGLYTLGQIIPDPLPQG